MNDFSKNMLDKFASGDSGLRKIQSNIQLYNETVKDAESKNYKREFISEMKDKLSDGIIKDYEGYRAEELTKVETEVNKITDRYNKDMVQSLEARKQIDILDKQYAALSDSEIKQKYADYILGKVNDPWELETLSRHLKNVDKKAHEQFRKHFHERGDDQPYKKINPELFKHQDNLKNLQYGECLIYISGQGQNGKPVRIAQVHKIRDLI